MDVIARLEPIILEMERHREPLLIVAHQGILRIIYAFYMGLSRAEAPYVSVPLNCVLKLTPRYYFYLSLPLLFLPCFFHPSMSLFLSLTHYHPSHSPFSITFPRPLPFFCNHDYPPVLSIVRNNDLSSIPHPKLLPQMDKTNPQHPHRHPPTSTSHLLLCRHCKVHPFFP